MDTLERINWKLNRLSKELVIALNKLEKGIDILTERNNVLQNELNRQEIGINQLFDKVKELQENPPLERVFNNLNIEQVATKKRVRHIEQHLTNRENNTVEFTSYEGLQWLKKKKAEFDNLNNKSNKKGSK